MTAAPPASGQRPRAIPSPHDHHASCAARHLSLPFRTTPHVTTSAPPLPLPNLATPAPSTPKHASLGVAKWRRGQVCCG